MKVEDISFPDPFRNLEYDDEILRRADTAESGEVLRFWQAPSVFIVLGRTCREELEVNAAACRQDRVPVLRRSSGGGTVVQGPGCLNFSLILSKARHPEIASITRSYQYILSRVIAALGACGVAAELRPLCDLVLSANEKKFSGNAQRRGHRYILHHGTLLHGMDLSLVPRYLCMPPKMPDYRQGRAHEDFVTNVALDVPAFKEALARVWVCGVF